MSCNWSKRESSGETIDNEPVTKLVEEWVHKAIAKHAGIVWLDRNGDLTLKMAVLSSQTIPAYSAIALWTHSSTRFVTG